MFLVEISPASQGENQVVVSWSLSVHHPAADGHHFNSKLPGVSGDCLVGLVVRRLPRERKIQGSNPACTGIFSGSTHTSDLKIGTPVATLPGAWRYRVSAGTGRPGVSIL